jgi:glycosyltransferase involved in cell wall biosynthesis
MKICIGVVTRNRPAMLAELLDTFASMHKPDNAEIHFIVVENNDVLTVGGVVDAVRAKLQPSAVTVAVETQRGIPFARNAVLDIALNSGADYLTFVDDDERVDQNWLIKLLERCVSGPFDLVGGAVLIDRMPSGSTWGQRMIWRGLQERNQHVAVKLAHRAATRGPNSVNVSTANWMGRLEFFRQSGLRFDEAIGVGSGSDRRLYKDCVKLGGKTSWTGQAVVYDTVPLSRLSLQYQFQRGRDHTAFLFAGGQQRASRRALIGKAAARFPRVLYYGLLAPFTGGRSIVMAARMAGDMMGFLDAYRGVFGSHYDTVTGQ